MEIVKYTSKPVEDRIFDVFDQIIEIFGLVGITDIEEIFDAIGLKIVYDPENKSGNVAHEGRGSYSWSERTIYTGDNGIGVSLLHESLHALDCEAAPTPQEFLPVFSGRRTFVPWMHRSSWIINGVHGGWLGEIDTSERLFFEEAIMSAVVALKHFNKISPKFDVVQFSPKEIARFVRFVIDGDEGLILKAVQNTKRESVDFVAERFVDLLHFHMVLQQQQAGMQPYGLPMSHYEQAETFWMPEWMEYHEKQIIQLLTNRVEIIRQRIADGTLVDMHKYQEAVTEVVNSGTWAYLACRAGELVGICARVLSDIDKDNPWHWSHLTDHILDYSHWRIGKL